MTANKLLRPNSKQIDWHERIDMTPSSVFWGEHRSRYRFAAGLVSGRIVLDVACGTGYGAPILREGSPKALIGFDLSVESLGDARREPAWNGVCQVDCQRLPVARHAVSCVTSFETVEHIEDPEAFVHEIRRVLEPTGTLVMSTPNALYTKPVDGKPANPYHHYEFRPDEFEALLRPHFPRVQLLGQRPTPSSGVTPWTLKESREKRLGPLRVLSWKVQSRLPYAIRDGMSKILFRRTFYPGEDDFSFREEDVETGHVLLAVCGR